MAIAAFTLLGWTWGHGTGWSRLWTNWVVGPDVNPLDRVKVTLTTIGGVGAVGYLVIKYRERASQERNEASEKLIQAVEQLGSQSPQVRIAGVYALADVADKYQDHYRQRVVDILCGYLRTDRLPENGKVRHVIEENGIVDPELLSSNDGAVESTILATLANHLKAGFQKDNDSSANTQPGPWSECAIDLHGAILTEHVDFSGAHMFLPNFEGAIFLKKVDFSQTSLKRANFKLTTLVDAIFEHASLGYAIFERADLRKATFESSELHDSTFKYANLVDVTFMEAKLNHTTFTGAEIRGVTFESARIEGSIFTGAAIHDSNFTRAEIRGVTFESTRIEGSIFTGAAIHDSNFTRAEIRGVTFESTRIEHTIFVRATLKNVRFKNKYDDREIKRIDFTDTSFDDVEFKGVSLVYPVFWTSADEETLIEVMSDLDIETAGRKLENIVFDESRIYNANFKGGNLRNICFRETEFYQTSFDDANLEGAKFYRTFFYETSFSNARFGASFNPIYLEDSSFAGARLCESDFTGAEIYRSDFTRAELERNIFIDAILQTTDFTGATLVSPVFWETDVNTSSSDAPERRLVNVVFKQSKIYDTDFRDVRLKDIDFCKTQFHTADFEGATFEGTRFDEALFDVAHQEEFHLDELPPGAHWARCNPEGDLVKISEDKNPGV